MTDQQTTNGTGVIIRRFSFDSHIVKVGDIVRCTDGMRHDGSIGHVVAFLHNGRRHPVIVTLCRKDGTPGRRPARFYSWEKLDITGDTN